MKILIFFEIFEILEKKKIKFCPKILKILNFNFF